MIIGNRHKKPYSDRLFSELCIMYLLMDNANTLESYYLDKHFRKTRRTLYRYIEDINASCPFLDLHFEGENRHRYLTASLSEGYDRYDLNYFIRNACKDYGSNDRLLRCVCMLASNLYSLQLEDDVDEEDLECCRPEDHLIIDDNHYVFADFDTCDELYEKTSLRTKQRDARFIKDVLIRMKNENSIIIS